MRIEKLRTYRFQMDLDEPIADARNTIRRRGCVLVRLELEGGLVGWGEAAAFAGCEELVVATLRFLGEKIEGWDGSEVASVHDRLMHETQHFGRRGVVVSAISAIDCALWDALGKAAGLPVYKLLGACRSAIRTYWNAGYYPGDDAHARAALRASIERVVERGALGAKIKIGRFDAKDDAERIRIARELLGAERDLMVDANACLHRRALHTLDRACLAHDVRWIEEPVPLARLATLREVRERTTTPIAGYELEMTLPGYAELIEERVVDVVQPDTIWSGGITTCMRVAAVAAAHATELVPHNFASVVALASNAHLVAATPTGGWLELDSNDNPFLWDLDPTGRWVPDQGRIDLPDLPGLGVEPDVARLAGYEVR